MAKLEDGDFLRLSKYATTDDSKYRYFKNKLGGLGQYYLNTLRDAGLILGDLREVRYTTERGLALAEAFDEGVARKRFFDVLEEDEVSVDVLDELHPFCVCQIPLNRSEHTALVDLFFNRQGTFSEDNGENRRHTLALLLDLAT